MARQTGVVQLSGTIGKVTHYVLNGKPYSRKKSSLSKRKIKTAECFAPTRVLNDLMTLASPMASKYYRTLSSTSRNVTRYRKMCGLAQHLLAKGGTVDDVHAALKKMRDEFEKSRA